MYPVVQQIDNDWIDVCTGSPDRRRLAWRQSFTVGQETHRTALTTSRITRDVAISILSTPTSPSARVGPTLRSNTGFFSSSACLTSLWDAVSSRRDPGMEMPLTGKLKRSREWSRREIACPTVLYHETCRARRKDDVGLDGESKGTD